MKVLIVDDNAFNRQLLEMIVSDHNYDVVSAENGRQAVDAVMADPSIDIVLMDVNMPVMDGVEATRQIKKQCSDRFIPIVFVTALDNEETLANCLANGGEDFVPKPVNEDVLVAKLKAHSRTVELYRELKNSHQELDYHHRLIDREHKIVENIFNRCTGRMERGCKNIRYYMSPMSQFNGDIFLAERNFTGGLYVLLGDFTGHGLAAAIGCLPVSDIFFSMTRKKAPVGKIANEINSKLQGLLPDNMFFCATIIELDQSGDRITIWSGGMNDIFLLDSDNKLHGKVHAQHMPLGILNNQEFDEKTEIITPFIGLRAYAYTDGVVEAANSADELFGEERLIQYLQSRSSSAIENMSQMLDQFTGGTEQSDDIGIVEITGKSVEFEGESRLNTKEANEIREVLPWNIRLKLTENELKNPSVMDQIVRLICSIENAEQHESILYALLNELYSNALEHGVLNLDSKLKERVDGFEQYYSLRREKLQALRDGEINLEIAIRPGRETKMSLELSDSGNGFDVNAICPDMEDNDGSYARGVNLVESLCEELHYTNNGRTVKVVYNLQNH